MGTRLSAVSRGVLAAGAAAALVAALGAGSPASAEDGAPAAAPALPAKTISIRTTTKRLFFTGSSTVKTGQLLRVRNLSNPKQHGPHTFTLVASNVIPRSRKAGEQCFTPGKICLTAAIAHEFDEKTEKVNKPLVEAGKLGWDKRFSRTVRSGDSWYSETKGETFEQVVSAKAGTILRYMCVVHPEMQGKIRVTG
jgi:plastocyanin